MDDDFGWFHEAASRFAATIEPYELGDMWDVRVHEPATEAQILATETAIGFPLPPSLRSFYEKSNGAQLGTVEILSVEKLAEHTLESRRQGPETYNESFDDLIDIVDLLGEDNRYLLDRSKRRADGEYPLINAWHETGPHEWRTNLEGDSFGSWLRSFVDEVCERHFYPIYGEPLSEATWSARWHHNRAVSLLADGATAAARHHLYKAMSCRHSLDGADHDGFLADVDLHRQLQNESPGEAFIARLLARMAGAIQSSREIGARFGYHLTSQSYGYDTVAQHPGRTILPEFTTLTREFSEVALFKDRDDAMAVSLTLHGRPLLAGAMRITSLKPDWHIIGRIGTAFYTATHMAAYDYVATDPQTREVFRVPFRVRSYEPPDEGPPAMTMITIVFGEVVTPTPTPVEGIPIRAATDIDAFLDEAFARFKRHERAFTLD
jgi:hypothetical protein